MHKSNKRIPQQGEIWLVNFKKIKEASKPFRPCLVISNNDQNESDEEVIVSPLTTQEVIAGEIQFFEVLVEASQETGLDEPSRILLNRIHTIDKELRLIKKLGRLDRKT
jgi:mRNA-degrading endonuclease toxin of MazEF toxin-antitoxin module